MPRLSQGAGRALARTCLEKQPQTYAFYLLVVAPPRRLPCPRGPATLTPLDELTNSLASPLHMPLSCTASTLLAIASKWRKFNDVSSLPHGGYLLV